MVVRDIVECHRVVAVVFVVKLGVVVFKRVDRVWEEKNLKYFLLFSSAIHVAVNTRVSVRHLQVFVLVVVSRVTKLQILPIILKTPDTQGIHLDLQVGQVLVKGLVHLIVVVE